ncbi:MAG: glycosyltransferase [Chthoniobacterales bacterium]|nr:glycosyltransferase [Chthoniobacterales bacterium]
MNPARLLVVHWNQPDACAATVCALLAQQVSLQVTVIDNHSEEAAFQQLRASLGPEIEIVRLETNRGWGGALNVLLQRWLSEETSSYCFISAHDTRVEADCLRFLLKAAEGDPRLGIVCPQYPEPFVAKLSSLRGVHPETVVPREPGVVQEVDAPHGTLMLVRRECLQEIGLFDERYFAYGDEHELGARARRRGWKVAMVWGAIVINPGTWTASALRSYLFARNSLLLVHDYFGPPAAWLRGVLLLGNTLLLLVSAQKDEVFSARARWQGVSDHFAGRYGKPKLR